GRLHLTAPCSQAYCYRLHRQPLRFRRYQHRLRSASSAHDGLQPAGGQKGNSNCAKWCHAVFGPNTPAAGQCTSDAAHGGGLCRQCGNVDPSSICCNRNGSGYCDGTVAGATCCPTGQHCQNGDCVPNCTGAGETCSVGTDCCSGSCCGGTCCDSGNCC